MNDTASINEKNLKELFDAFGHYFPSDTVYVSDKPFKSFYGDYNWKSRKDFIDFIRRLTGVEIKNEKDIADIKLAQNKIVKLSAKTTEEKPVDSNEPDKWTREAQEIERQKREAEIEKTKKDAEKQVNKFKESLKNRIEKQKEIQNKLEGKKVYAKVVPPEPEEANDFTKKFIEEVKNYPQSFRKDLSSKIEEQISTSDIGKNLSKEEVRIIADKVANDTVTAIKNPVKQVENTYETAILNSVSKSDILSKTIDDKSLQDFLNQESSEIAFNNNQTLLSRNVLSSFNENLAESVFGPDPQKIDVLFFTKQESGATHTIDLQQLNSGYGDLLNTQSQFFNQIGSLGQDQLQGFLLGKARFFLDGQIAKLPADNLISGLYNSSFGQQVLNFVGLSEYSPLAGGNTLSFLQQIPGSAPVFEWIGSTFGIDFAAGVGAVAPTAEIAGAAIATTEGTIAVGGGAVATTGIVATEAGAALATGTIAGASGVTTGAVAGTAGGAAAGAVAGSVIPVVGTIIGTIVGFIASKIPWDKIGKFLKEWGGVIGIGLLTGGGLLTSVPLLAAGTLFLIGGLGAAKSPAVFLAGILIALKALLKPPALQIGKMLTIIFLVVPIIVAFIMLVINSGAYVVPPTTNSFSSNPYIEVSKVASPAGPFQNSDLPLSITYTITIKAKKGPLGDIVIGDSCQIVSESGSKKCSVPELSVTETVSPTEDKVISYTQVYSGEDYIDSFVINTVTVRANTSTGGRQEVLATNSIKIGEPPEDCPNNSWPLANNVGLNDITQGPSAPGCSHKNLKNAIDVGVSGEIAVAVHSGIATVGNDSCVGKYIKITSNCGGNTFSTLYGHMGAVSVKNGQKVTLGQTLGITDNTGSCTSGDHLHFEFQTKNNIPTVQKPYLIRDIPVACCDRKTCNP